MWREAMESSEEEMESSGVQGQGTVNSEIVVTEMFSEEEVRQIFGFERGDEYVEMVCGITTSFYGDYGGKLRVFANGDLEITCKCYIGCPKEQISPAEFEKHSALQSNKNWRDNIWVIIGDEKVPLSNTRLLKYYNSKLLANGGACHRDEYIQCSQCKKMRRFHLRNMEECRRYHDALANVNWKCSDVSDDGASCDDDEERACRRAIYRGCFRSLVCSGCETCVCFGCETCRFRDCDCRTCVDYYQNAEGV